MGQLELDLTTAWLTAQLFQLHHSDAHSEIYYMLHNQINTQKIDDNQIDILRIDNDSQIKTQKKQI